MARKSNTNAAAAALQKSLPGMAPPQTNAPATPEAVGTVVVEFAGECRRSTQHTVERLQRPDGSVSVQRTCTVCDAVQKITVSKVVAERTLTVEPPNADPTMKDTEMADPWLPIDSKCHAADNEPTKP